ncbi:MAG: helix-turn-helix transcriptional regulator [Anaerovibrio sp.]|nr:helix-turn-helix transcriptional regulator [Anaerovibrio sp.]
MTISECIFERLKQLNMTQKEFGERTGIVPSTISLWFID